MDDSNSRDDEKKRELARQQGRQQEQDLQRDRELAAEKGRKQGVEEERVREHAREKKKDGYGGTKIIIGLIILVTLVALVGLWTISVSVTNVTPGNPLPYTTKYAVTFPEGQIITIGNSHITVLSYQNELISDIDGDRQKLVIGEDRVIAERRAVITTFGVITLMDTHFQINLTYKGDRDNRAYFDMAIHTSKQVPDVLLKNLLPAAIEATPI